MKKILLFALLFCSFGWLHAQKASGKKPIIISSEADLAKYQDQLQPQKKTQTDTSKKAIAPNNLNPEDYSDEELQQILEWYAKEMTENPEAFKSKSVEKTPPKKRK